MAPTHVSTTTSNAAGINGSNPQTVTLTVAIGDRLVIWASMADNAATVGTPTFTGTASTGVTASLAKRDANAANFSGSYLWTTNAVTVAGSITVSASKSGGSGTFYWTLGVERFSSVAGFGASVTAQVSSGAPTVNITTTDDHSAIVVVDSDWNAGASGSRTWRTNAGALTESLVDTDTTTSSTLTCYIGYHADAGAIGTYAVGLSAPGSQKYSIVALEVLALPASLFLPFFT